MPNDRSGRVVAFATLGILNLTQELAGAVLADIEGAEPDLVAEETLCLVGTATARAAEVGLQENRETTVTVVSVLMDLPFIYRDYLIGGDMLERNDPAAAEGADEVYRSLQRKLDFYRVHLPENQFPGESVLGDKMGLWMGRISPPKLPEMPMDRLSKLGLVQPLFVHLKLVLAYCRRSDNG